MTKLSLIVAAAALSAVPAFAQGSVVVPVNGRDANGNGATKDAFGYTAFHVQQVYDASAVASVSASINEIAFRYQDSVLTAGTVSNVTVKLSHSSVTPSTMGTTFATNVTATETTVFTGTVNMPAAALSAFETSPFSVQIPIAAPYSYTVANGNLLMDITAANPTPATVLPFNMDCSTPNGHVQEFGSNGPNDFNYRVTVSGQSNNLGNLKPGGGIQFNGSCGSWVNPGGGDVLSFVRLAQPIDLGTYGLPNNKMYLDPNYVLHIQPYNWQSSFIGKYNEWVLPIPNWTSLLGATLYCQSYGLVPGVNAFGGVTTNAKQIVIGDSTVRPVQLVTSLDPAAATGTLRFGAGTGGLVTRFSGTIN